MRVISFAPHPQLVLPSVLLEYSSFRTSRNESERIGTTSIVLIRIDNNTNRSEPAVSELGVGKVTGRPIWQREQALGTAGCKEGYF